MLPERNGSVPTAQLVHVLHSSPGLTEFGGELATLSSTMRCSQTLMAVVCSRGVRPRLCGSHQHISEFDRRSGGTHYWVSAEAGAQGGQSSRRLRPERLV